MSFDDVASQHQATAAALWFGREERHEQVVQDGSDSASGAAQVSRSRTSMFILSPKQSFCERAA